MPILVALPEQLGDHVASGHVDFDDITKQHFCVALVAQNLPGSESVPALGQDSCRDLVQQRLEQVVLGAGDHRDVNRSIFELLGRRESTEA